MRPNLRCIDPTRPPEEIPSEAPKKASKLGQKSIWQFIRTLNLFDDPQEPKPRPLGEPVTFYLLHKDFSVKLCRLPSREESSPQVIFDDEFGPWTFAKQDIKKPLREVSLQLGLRGIRIRSLTTSIMQDLTYSRDYESVKHAKFLKLMCFLADEGFRLMGKFPDGRVGIFLPTSRPKDAK